jgi:hypothetical protein
MLLRLTRIYDDRGCVAQLSNAAPGVVFHPVTGKPVKVGTRSWARILERLEALR